jgi:hypothetical protein
LKGSFSLLMDRLKVERARSTLGSWEFVHASFAHVAQLAEHILGKDEVTSSILVMGSRFGAARSERKRSRLSRQRPQIK